MTALRALAPFLERSRRAPSIERCELCGAPIADGHGHLANVASRKLLCVCRACELLFEPEGAARGKYRAVPARYLHDASLGLTESAWARLGVPVRMAFVVRDSSRTLPAAFYPSPAGAIEGALDEETANDLRAASAALDALAPDVEAWLLDGRTRGTIDGYIVPVPTCYELVAHVRRNWKGFDGGEGAHAAIDAFFASVRARVRAYGGAP